MPSKLDELIAYHSSDCMKIGYGKCHKRVCLKRGGWKPGDPLPVNFDCATCEPLETVEILRAMKRACALVMDEPSDNGAARMAAAVREE